MIEAKILISVQKFKSLPRVRKSYQVNTEGSTSQRVLYDWPNARSTYRIYGYKVCVWGIKYLNYLI